MRTTKVRCIDTGEVFSCIKAAAEAYGIINRGGITECCRGRAKTAGGLRWEYAQSPKCARHTLCWKCHRSDHFVDDPTPCPWATRFEPVEGWDAVETAIGGCHREVPTYIVIKCPLFKPNERRERNG